MNKSPVSFTDILSVFQRLTEIQRFWIAYSGGLDSSVLLHLLSTNRDQLDSDIIAIHVNHQISKNSDVWTKHCEITCEQLGIELKKITIDASNPEGTGPEAHARQLRYDAIRQLIDNNDVLLTAHHQDDLAETFILQLMRGAGPEGLAGIPLIIPFGIGWIMRPLLGYTRKQLEDYARNNNLEWVEDESNLDLDIDRNFVRKNVMPCLEQRWPAATRTIARSARHQSDMIEILKEIAVLDFEKVRCNTNDSLNIAEFKKLSESRQKNLLRYWFRLNGHSLPSNNIIRHILSGIINARNDSMPLIQWKDTEIRRYRDKIYIMKPSGNTVDGYTWHMETPLTFEWGSLHAKPVTGRGVRASSIIDNTIEVRFRAGGEKIYPVGRHETHKLKKLFQETGIPPWRREKIPLLYINNQLAAVPGYWIDKKFNTGENEAGWEITLLEH